MADDRKKATNPDQETERRLYFKSLKTAQQTSRPFVKWNPGLKVMYKGRMCTVAWVLVRRGGLFIRLRESGDFVCENEITPV